MDDVQRAIDDQFKDVVDPDYENDVLKERVTVLQGGKYIMSFKKKGFVRQHFQKLQRCIM